MTCYLTANNELHQVWVDGVDKTASVAATGDMNNWGSRKTLTFDDTASVLAIRAKDNSCGCACGGLAIECSSTDVNSEWNMNSETHRANWVVASKPSFSVPPAPDNRGHQWYQVGYKCDPLEFLEPRGGTTTYADSTIGNDDMCEAAGGGRYWYFLYGNASAGGGGDPHFHTFGGIYFSWQGICDLILMKTSQMTDTNSELLVHIRTKKVRKWSAISDIAIQIDKDVVEIGSKSGKFVLNGKEVESAKSDLFSVTKSFPTAQKLIVVYNFEFQKNRKLEVKANSRSQMLSVTFRGHYPNSTTGLVGSPFYPGYFSRDGRNMTEKEVKPFVESWQINDKDPHLFQENREPQFPAKCEYYEPPKKLPFVKDI